MKIKLFADASERYRVRCCMPAQPLDQRYFEMLEAVDGQALEVETEHLFEDQYNTAPITGVSDNGLRVMDYLVEEVIDDARIGKMKCNYCGTSAEVAVSCPKCGKSEYLKAFYLWRTKLTKKMLRDAFKKWDSVPLPFEVNVIILPSSKFTGNCQQ